MKTRWINAALSLLLVAAGIVARGPERANNLALGLCIFLVAFFAMASSRARRLNTLLGAWVAFSPFTFAYRDAGIGWTDVAVGLLVVAASLWPDRAADGPAPLAQRG